MRWSAPWPGVLGLFCFLVLTLLPAPAPARQTVAVSRATDGVIADNHNYAPFASATGRYVVFHSMAANLVDGDANGKEDVYWRDLVTAQTRRVSLAHDGDEPDNHCYNASVSADGRFVAFASEAANLVAGDNNVVQDIFVRDLSLGATTRVSLGPGNVEANGPSLYPLISADGRMVVFFSGATNLTDPATNGKIHAYQRDLVTGQTRLISQNSAGAEGDGNDYFGLFPINLKGPCPSGDGRYVAFNSLSTNLVVGDTNDIWDIFVRDVTAGATTRASLTDSGGEAEFHQVNLDPAVSDDGRYVSFLSFASNLAAGDTNGACDVYVRDAVAGRTLRASLAQDGAEPNSDCEFASVNDAGQVSFMSSATNLVPGDTNGQTDMFLRDLTTGRTIRASVASDGAEANASGLYGHLAGRAGYVAFVSAADNLVPGVGNHRSHIFVNGPFLEDAVGAPDLEILTPPGFAWAPDYAQARTGDAAARAGWVADGESSWMKATVTGPGLVGFWWKVSCQAGSDYLTFSLDGVPQPGRISGETDWAYQVFTVPAGEHVLAWEYQKDGAGLAGFDAGWVDDLTYAPVTRRTMYRAYNPHLLYHFFTTRGAEHQNAVVAGYQDESTDPAKLFYVSQDQAPGTVALHRLYNPNSGRHYYTRNNGERDALVALGWLFERDEGYLFTSAALAPADAVEVYRLYHPVIGTHLYTKNAFEADWVVANLPPWELQSSLGWAYDHLVAGARAADQTLDPNSPLLRAAATQAGVDLAGLPAWRTLAGAGVATPAPGSGSEAGQVQGAAAGPADQTAGTTVSRATGGTPGWRDFDGDGVDDLVRADPATGRVSLALMSGAGPREVLDLGRLAEPGWQLADVTDLDGDGGPDLLWWNPATREVAFWLLSGTVVAARPVVARLPGGSSLAGAGDYNGDGRVEVAWRDAAGRVYFTAARVEPRP
ncbi:MAG: VCBS repeat-containing protein [Deltaproteobacteria bacterium]|nr:VCBS repeat-containing protein [Deltaproteobacteria bacterium]